MARDNTVTPVKRCIDSPASRLIAQPARSLATPFLSPASPNTPTPSMRQAQPGQASQDQKPSGKQQGREGPQPLQRLSPASDAYGPSTTSNTIPANSVSWASISVHNNAGAFPASQSMSSRLAAPPINLGTSFSPNPYAATGPGVFDTARSPLAGTRPAYTPTLPYPTTPRTQQTSPSQRRSQPSVASSRPPTSSSQPPASALSSTSALRYASSASEAPVRGQNPATMMPRQRGSGQQTPRHAASGQSRSIATSRPIPMQTYSVTTWGPATTAGYPKPVVGPLGKTQPPSYRVGNIAQDRRDARASLPTDERAKANYLLQQVLEYLAKKGYSRTEAMLRKESAHQDAEGRPIHGRAEDAGGDAYFRGYDLISRWIDNVLDIYKPELSRLLWPVFVYSLLTLVADFYPNDSKRFLDTYKEPFQKEHEDDLRALSTLRLPEHLQTNNIAQIYRNNKYRVTLSNMAFTTLIQFLEANERGGGSVITALINNSLHIVTVDRVAVGAERSLSKLLNKTSDQDVPPEDEGIPGHNPGSANTDRNAPPVLAKLALGPMPMEPELMEDVKAELQEHDAAHPPAPGRNTLVEEFEQRIKREPTDDVPSRDQIPFPPSLARDVAMEVQRVKENRDRFRIEGRTGGVGPGVSVTMFTFHNTFDSLNCIEFSGDNALVAVGTSESYIRVWSLDNRPLTSPLDPPNQQPSSSRRLIGHSGPVYALSFSPSVALPLATTQTNGTNGTTNTSSSSHPRYLLSSSADCTIRLWSLDTFTNLVAYRSHSSPVWDVRFSPLGHYFLSASADRTARLWSTATISPLRLFVGHDSDVECCAWHPNAAYVFTASGNGDRSVRMWDIQRGNAVRLFTGHVGNITALSCAPSGKLVASADDRGEILIWDLATGRLNKRLRGHGRGGVWSLDWSVESSVLVSGGADGTVRVWDVASSDGKTDGKADGKVVAEGGAGAKIDGTGVAAGAKKGKGKEVTVSLDQISAFPTKKSPVYKVRFTQMNLVVAGGAYLP